MNVRRRRLTAALIGAGPSPLVIGTVVVGASATATVTLSNAGSAITSVSAATSQRWQPCAE